MVATSHPEATMKALEIIKKRTGNAVDAALATAITLSLVEPTGCGLGSDAYAIIWDGQSLHGLNSSGRSPALWTESRFFQFKRNALQRMGKCDGSGCGSRLGESFR